MGQVMVYKLDLRDLWDKNTKIREKTCNILADRISIYQKLIQVLESAIDKKRSCRIKHIDVVYKFEHIPLDLISIVLLDYWQARAFDVTSLEEKNEDEIPDINVLNLTMVKNLVETIWKLELAARRYWSIVMGEKDNVHVFIDTVDAQMAHSELEHSEHLKVMLVEYRNGMVELKMFINRTLEYFLS